MASVRISARLKDLRNMTTSLKSIAALPPDVRKGSAFPSGFINSFRRGCASPHAGKDARAPSLNPIGNKNISLALHLVVSVRSEHQLLPVRREHRETVEGVVVSDPLHS